MAVLEKAIGSTDGKEIATMGSEPNLVSALEKLEEKVFFLDKVNLDMLEMRLQSLMDKLKEIKSKPIPSEKLTKVSEMLEIAQKWDSVADSLPSIVDRLSALDTIHQQGWLLKMYIISNMKLLYLVYLQDTTNKKSISGWFPCACAKVK